MPGAQCARSLACEISKAHEHSHYGHTGSPGIPYAMVLTVSFVLSPVIGLICHRRLQTLPSANLTPASRRQDHTTSPSASARFVKRAACVHRIPPRVRDDRDTPLVGAGRGELVEMICPTGKAKYFCGGGLDRLDQIDWFQ
jgi:hypothetical protein